MNWFKKKPFSPDLVLLQQIVEKFLFNPQVKKLISPISEEYLLIDEVNSVNICISNSRFRVANHLYTYSKDVPLNFTESLQKKIRIQIESEIQQIKSQVFENEINLLEKINIL